MDMKRLIAATALFGVAVAGPASAETRTIEGNAGGRIDAVAVATFEEPWAMTFLPDGRMLVTEKGGGLFLVAEDGGKSQVSGVPKVAYGGQGGFGDVLAHPDFDSNAIVYISYAESGSGGRGAAVARATLEVDGDRAALGQVDVIWRQEPKVSGGGHYSLRLAFAPDGKLFITSGDRQKLDPAQDLASDLGKIIRLNDDGSVPEDNPFADEGGRAGSYWSIGHRNMLGIAFDAGGRLWVHEMGPRGGDELNLIEPGQNYGWPAVSEGRHYGGTRIPAHSTRPEFRAPEVTWTPVIAPSGLVIYSGDLFAEWVGNALIGGLASQALVRVSLEAQADGKAAAEVERFDMSNRIREVEQGPDGSIWLLEDGSGGRLLRLSPAGGG